MFKFLGWYLTYIDRDPETIAAQERKAKKERMDKDDEERTMEFIRHQVEQGSTKKNDEPMKKPFERPEDDKPVVIQLSLKPKNTGSVSSIFVPPVKSRETNLITEMKQEVTEESMRPIKKERNILRKGWLMNDLVVKVMTKALGNEYYKAKGIIRSVEDSGFVAEVKLKSPEIVQDHVVKVDQEHLETVIPAIGKSVVIVSGKYKHSKAIVRKILVKEFSVQVELEAEKPEKTLLLRYEQICKYRS